MKPMILESTQKVYGIESIITHGIAQIDRDGRYVRLNQTYIHQLNMVGTPDLVIGKYLYDLNPEVILRETFLDLITSHECTSSKTHSYQIDISGNTLSIGISLLIQNGIADGALIVITEITDDAHTQRMIRDMYRSICEDQSEIIIRILATGHIVFTNEAACRFFGLSRKEMYGTIIGTRHLNRLRELLDSGPDVAQKSIIYYRKVSRYIDYTARLTCDEKGEPFLFTFVGRDVTDYIETMNNLARYLYSMVTNKEREVIECLMKNMTRKEIAHVLDITTNSYDTLVARIKKRWGTKDINNIISIILKYYLNNITTDLW